MVRQPGDGSCLFHSLRFGLNRCSVGGGAGGAIGSAGSLRGTLARWVLENSSKRLAETPVSLWVKWDSGMSTQQYASAMAKRGWGGGIEMAACSHAFGVAIWVYEKRRGGYERISCFDSPRAKGGGGAVTPGGSRIVHLLYQGSCHYDALLPESAEVKAYLATASPSAGCREGRGAPPTGYAAASPSQQPQRQPFAELEFSPGGVRGSGGKGSGGKGAKGSPRWSGGKGKGSPASGFGMRGGHGGSPSSPWGKGRGSKGGGGGGYRASGFYQGRRR